MTLFDLLEAVPRYIARHMFPVYVETPGGELAEVERIDFRNGCAGTVLVANFPRGMDAWDDDLCLLRDDINAAWTDARCYRSDAAKVFDPTGDVISVEAVYRLLDRTNKLLNQMFEDGHEQP